MEGGCAMSYETKVILKLLAAHVAKSKTLAEAYDAIADAASVEGLSLPTYKEAVEQIEEKRKQ